MESLTVVLIVSVVVVAAAFIACLAIYKHKWRREVKPTIVSEAQSTPEHEKLDIGKFRFGKAPAAMIERRTQENQPRRSRRLASESQAQGTSALP